MVPLKIKFQNHKCKEYVSKWFILQETKILFCALVPVIPLLGCTLDCFYAEIVLQSTHYMQNKNAPYS